MVVGVAQVVEEEVEVVVAEEACHLGLAWVGLADQMLVALGEVGSWAQVLEAGWVRSWVVWRLQLKERTLDHWFAIRAHSTYSSQPIC